MAIIQYDCGWQACNVAFDNREEDNYRLCVSSYSIHPFTNFVDLVESQNDEDRLFTRGVLPLCDPATKILFPAPSFVGSDIFALTTGDSLNIYEIGQPLSQGSFAALKDLIPESEQENMGSKALSVVQPMLRKKMQAAKKAQAEHRAVDCEYTRFNRPIHHTKSFRLQSSVAPVAGTVATSFDWSQDKPAHMIVSYTGGIIAIYNVEADKEVVCAAVHDDTPVFDVCFCDANSFASVGQDGSLRTIDQRDMSETIVVGDHPKKGEPFTRLYCNPDNTDQIACIGLNDEEVLLYDRRRPGDVFCRLEGGHKGPINGAAWSRDTIVTAGEDKVCNIWRLSAERPMRYLTYDAPAAVNGVAWRRSDKPNSCVGIATGEELQLLRV